MSKMIDLIRADAVPASIIQSAARGELSIPDADSLEILVYLAQQSETYGEQARWTLEDWEEEALRSSAASTHTAPEVLEYLTKNLRPSYLMAIMTNPAVPNAALLELAKTGPRDAVLLMSDNARVAGSIEILRALTKNPFLVGPASQAVRQKLWIAEGNIASEFTDEENADRVLAELAPDEAQPDNVLDEELNAYLLERAAELAAIMEQEFQPIGSIQEEAPQAEEPLAEAAAAAAAAGAVAAAREKARPDVVRLSCLAKISKLNVKGRIQLAFKGNKEERSILIRDSTKLVAQAVLDSPKISDGEVEKIANQRNVLEAVLRGFSMKRRFMKNYMIVRNLTFNPRTPLDVSLGLMKHLQAADLKGLSGSKDVADTVRKLALKMYKQKMNPNKKTTD
jgi:hypothetical protein